MRQPVPAVTPLPGAKPRRRGLLSWNTVLPVAIVIAAAVVPAILLLQEEQDVAELRTSIFEENRLRMQSSLAHVEEYFDAVYSTLLFISLDDDVLAMRQDSRHYIQRLYNRQWESHRLTEVYVVERDFTGERPPFMTFEREMEHLTEAEVHSPEREEHEYRTQMQHLQRFATNQTLEAQLSREIPLCAPEPSGEPSRGFVYSVPIRSGDKLMGLVAGMIQTRTVTELMRQGLSRQLVLLASERGDLILPEGADPGIAQWFRQRFDSSGAGVFFAHAGQGFPVETWQAHWSPAKIVAAQKWWVVYLHPGSDYGARTLLAGWVGHFIIAGSLLGVGLTLAFLVRSLGLRLEEQARHLQERRQLEREVQEASERVQRRIGEHLHEDLCQRLTGIEAASKLLEKRLGAAQLPETQVAAEISREIKGSWTSARQMADELQPVALQEHGFVAALEELAARARQRGGIVCQVEDHGFPEQLDTFVATHLYRIVQEAIHNVLQHAQASTLIIALTGDETQLQLTVSDNGVGIPDGAEAGPGMGLRIMRYRADLIGAEFGIRRGAERGTEISARFPRNSGGIKPAIDSDTGVPL